MPSYKDKNGTYYVKYKNTTKRGFKTKKQADLYEARLKIENSNYKGEIRMFDVINDFLECYKKDVSYTSYDRTNRIIINYIKPNIKDKYISSIKEIDCRQFYDIISDLNLSTSYKNDIFNTYKRIFEHAIKFFNLNSNPTKIFNSYKTTREEKLNKRNKEFNVWNNDEFMLFISKVNTITFKTLFITLYYTGMRLGEALALKWSDLGSNYLDINKSIPKLKKDGSFVIKEPKNVSSIRKVLLTDALIKCLLEFKQKEMQLSGFSEDWFIFGRLKPLSRSTINRIKDKAIDDSGVKRITIHDFRHSHASNLIADNVNIVSVSKRLGHSNIEMTLNTYTHLLSKTDDYMLDKIEKSSQNLLNNT